MRSIELYKKKYKEKVPRPDHWSGWNLLPSSIEFWLNGNNRIHERLLYIKKQDETWSRSILSP
jgi:pyridoxamine 5'-phosphate oxidase